MGKTCCFIGHRKIDKSEAFSQKLERVIVGLIDEGADTFLFGSRSEFDDLCHRIVTKLQKRYPQIKRIMYNCRGEAVLTKEEKEKAEKSLSESFQHEIILKDYDGKMMSDRLWSAGKASYVERNEDMINASDYCVFYYDPTYLPPKRKRAKSDASEYQPKSGTRLAFEYANQRKRGGKELKIVNIAEPAV